MEYKTVSHKTLSKKKKKETIDNQVFESFPLFYAWANRINTYFSNLGTKPAENDRMEIFLFSKSTNC